MAYTRAWNESLPNGAVEAASTLDTIIQNLKSDLRERLDDAFPDWSDDAVDPKRVVVHSGVLADRPADVDANTGELYYSTDTAELFAFDGSAWTLQNNEVSLVTYDDSQSAGSKSIFEAQADSIVSIFFSATTDGSGDFVLDAGEIAALGARGWLDMHSWQIVPGSPSNLAHFYGTSRTASLLTFRAFDFAGAALTATGVVGYLLAYIREV